MDIKLLVMGARHEIQSKSEETMRLSENLRKHIKSVIEAADQIPKLKEQL